MVLARDVVAHILLHVNAEAATSDRSQAPGVAERAQYVRDSVTRLASDTRQRSRDKIMLAISDEAALDSKQESFRRAVKNTLGEARPHLGLQAWVGQDEERRGG